MTDERPGRGPGQVVVTGAAVLSAYGPGTDALLAGVLSGRPAFAPVQRFDVSAHRVGAAAEGPGHPQLDAEIARAIGEACDDAALSAADRARTPLFLAVHGDPAAPRAAAAGRPAPGPEAFAAALAHACGLAQPDLRCYLSACVAASTAIGDAAAIIARGQAHRVVVAGGYLVEPDQFALFDAGRVLAADGQVRPFSAGRRGLLLGDGIGVVVIESDQAARARRARPLARIAGWGRSGDAYHPCQPRPDGHGLARAITAALGRAGADAADVGYINAHGSGTAASDRAEANAIRLALGEAADTVPVSSTKSLHGQALEASGALELIVTVLALRAGTLPVNAGYLGVDDECGLRLVLDEPLATDADLALSHNCAFGGANTALLVGLP
ncbi:MAG TPA: beta-ketoacyl synthase N-terminal-like domain-containing protein [Trebonia sp.]|nr:beta-ketoacyl synthase N-terminal-like domain-containing protein [Trebonia sp.]